MVLSHEGEGRGCIRVYQKHNGLQFELELKNQLVKSFQKILFDNSIEEFEHSLSKHFFYVLNAIIIIIFYDIMK